MPPPLTHKRTHEHQKKKTETQTGYFFSGKQQATTVIPEKSLYMQSQVSLFSLRFDAKCFSCFHFLINREKSTTDHEINTQRAYSKGGL